MTNMEITLRESFRRVKDDILNLQKQITELRAQNEKLSAELAKKQDRVISNQIKELKKISKNAQEIEKLKTASVKKTTAAKKKQKKYVASKTGSKFHIEDCPFAKNIKPKSKVKFSSKVKPLNEGYKPCACVK